MSLFGKKKKEEVDFVMKKLRFISGALAALLLSLSFLTCPVAFAAVDATVCATVPYAEATTQTLGQPIKITGTPNYNAATSNDTAAIFGFDTADGVWYVAVNKTYFEAFKIAAPAQEMTLYGTYAGVLDVNGMPILDIQDGAVNIGDSLKGVNEVYAAGQNVLNEQAAKGYRLHTITTANGGSKGLMGGDRIQATMVFEKVV